MTFSTLSFIDGCFVFGLGLLLFLDKALYNGEGKHWSYLKSINDYKVNR